ncbi:hypothetical protein [Kamptonema formosum]|uniref:hypothetical protein n=1 Tax=Kamptonema formosum TaxID=331992 RepID=UPI0012DC716E|nr:hypothetical protein [Oscillatoria sp. PCC 10802]
MHTAIPACARSRSPASQGARSLSAAIGSPAPRKITPLSHQPPPLGSYRHSAARAEPR